MLQEERTRDVDGWVVAGDVAIYRDLIAGCLGARAVTSDSIGEDARSVVLCANGKYTARIEALAADPGRRIVVLGVPEHDAIPYYEAGVYSVLPPDAPVEELRIAIEEAARDTPHFSPRQTKLVFDRLREGRTVGRDERQVKLTPREREVANLVTEGLRDKEIASQLVVSVSTVKKHVNRILTKLEVPNRHEVAARIGGVLGPVTERF